MADQSWMWTTLPDGLTPNGRGLRISVFLTPRLDPKASPPELSSFFPDWEDWPATLRRATFDVTYGAVTVSVPATTTTGANRVDTAQHGAADSGLWRALFDGTVFVRPGTFEDRSSDRVLSYDTVAVADLVQKLYANLAVQAGSGRLPTVSDVLADPDWQGVIDAVGGLDRRATDEKTGLRDPNREFDRFRDSESGSPQTSAGLLARLQLFHTPPAKPKPVTHHRTDDSRVEATWLEHQRATLPAPAEFKDLLDFHQIVSAMSSYPTILRRLGLVVDLVVARDQFADAADAPLTTAVRFPAGALTVAKSAPDASPATHARLWKRAFGAVSNPALPPEEGKVDGGLLDLDPARYALLQADVDGAGLKVMNFARSLLRLAGGDDRVDPVTRFEREVGAPSLRTAGLMLVHRERGSMLQDRLAANKAKHDAPTAPDLWAEDLVRGFRFDVWDANVGVWRSLCRRTASYDVKDQHVAVDEEEGTVRLAATTSPDKTHNADLIWLHEAVVSWTGWSLAAPPPGRAILPDDSVDTSSARTDAELPPGLDFRSEYHAVKGSLPRLRFGRRYWLRARAVDLAGNSLPFREKDYGPEDPKAHMVRFRRYEPVAAPTVALVRPEGGTTEWPAEGESMLRMAIRSFNDTPADNAVPTTQVARRYAVPPQVSARDAEQHGAIDAAGVVDATTFNLLANEKDRDAADPLAALVEETHPMAGPGDPAPVDTTFAVYREGQGMTYLSDPVPVEAAVRVFNHPGIPDTVVVPVPLYLGADAWPDPTPFKVEVFEDDAQAPHYDAATHTFRVPLAKGRRARVRLSMRVPKDALRTTFGVWDWLHASDQAAFEPMALDGQHWMLSPWHTIEVAHATQRPLVTPEFLALGVDRWSGATSAVPRFEATCSLRSTDRVDLRAEWHEPDDNPTAAGAGAAAVDRARGDTAFSVKITEPGSYALKIDGFGRGGFADHAVLGDDVIAVNSAKDDRAPDKHHEFHDTRYRRIEYWMEATTKFREFLPPALLTDPDPVTGDPVPSEAHIKVVGPRRVDWIPSSAPPPAPDVLYVVPTFGWARGVDDAGTKSSWRRGGGLRVYLDRPWHASGYGEMLGVVLPPATFAGNPDTKPDRHPYKSYVTQWGNDPIWKSAFVSGLAPKRSNFPLARTAPEPSGGWLPAGAPPEEADQKPGVFQVSGLVAPGTDWDSPVEVAPHDVFYDPDRRLWYCDIEIDQGASYWPFIRLALARYQPTSVGGAHLSSVVLADFMPLTADRWLSVTAATRGRRRQVRVFGWTYSDSSGHMEASRAKGADVSGTSVVEVWVERLDPAKGEDFGWERVTATVTPAGAPDARVAGGPAPPPRTFVPADTLSRARELQQAGRFADIVAEGLISALFSFLTLWEGDVVVPSTQAGARHRLVIAEYEEYLVDDDRPYDKVPTRKGRRLVFVEHVELD